MLPARGPNRLVGTLVTLTILGLGSSSTARVWAQAILPPAPGAIGGGNPLEGLGRPDDPNPARYEQTNPTRAEQEESGVSDDGSGSGTGKSSTNDSDSGQSDGTTSTEDVNGNSRPPLPPTPNSNNPQTQNANNNQAPNAPDHTSGRARQPFNGLVPPPPPFGLPPAPPVADSSPERAALNLMKHGNYKMAEAKLRALVANNPSDMHTRYLLAVTLVQERKYNEAKSVYSYVIKNARNPKLIELAKNGMAKL